MKISKEPSSKELKIKHRRDTLRCDICPPNRGENAKRKSKHGAKTPKYKTKGRG